MYISLLRFYYYSPYLFKGVLSTLKQRKQVLESVLDIWSGFESKKSACEQFMDRSEAKLVDIYSGLKNATSIAALQIEMAELKVCKIVQESLG